MIEVSITVAPEGETPHTYKFSQFPVTIGREPSCTLVIRHEAIPRELCTLWMDPESGVIHLEEKPGLTNPLCKGHRPVEGGVSGRALPLHIGPVKLDITAGEIAGKRSKLPRWKCIALALGALCLLAPAVLHRASIDAPRERTWADFPPVHFPAPPGDSTDDRLLVSRARELLSRRPSETIHRLRAVSLLERAAEIRQKSVPKDADGLRQEATRLKTAVGREYQRHVLSLLHHHSLGETHSVRREAGVVLTYLPESQAPIIPWLEKLSRGGPQ